MKRAIVIIAVVAAGIGAIALVARTPRTQEETPQAVATVAARDFTVSNNADSGAGSLREAIFAASRHKGPVRILCSTETIALASPLPPLVNPFGASFAAEKDRCALDASRLTQGRAFEIYATGGGVTGLRVNKARGAALVLRGSQLRVERSHFTGNGVGLIVADDASAFTVHDSEFTGNATGIEISASAGAGAITNCRFRANTKAAIWAVAPKAQRDMSKTVLVKGADFSGDALGAVFIRMPVRIEVNRFMNVKSAAVHVEGMGVTVIANRIHGAMTGIHAEGLTGGRIEGNEIDDTKAAILMRYPANCAVSRNRISQNGYGIIAIGSGVNSPSVFDANILTGQREDGVYLQGISPVLRGNEIRDSGAAGLRLVTVVAADGSEARANPGIEATLFERNRINDPLRETRRNGRATAKP